MAEPAKPRRPAVRPADDDDALAALNDHLGRFLRNADELLDEWARFGADVRARVGGEVERIGGAVEQAVDGAVERIAGRTAERVGDEVAGRLVVRLADVHAEIERVTRAARRASATAQELHGERRRSIPWIAGALGAALLADVLLIAMLVRAPASAPPPPRAPGVTAACDQLSRAWSDAAFAVVRAAGVAACGELADTVDAAITARLTAPPAPAADPGSGTDPGTGTGTDPGSGTGSGTGTGTGTGATKPRKGH